MQHVLGDNDRDRVASLPWSEGRNVSWTFSVRKLPSPAWGRRPGKGCTRVPARWSRDCPAATTCSRRSRELPLAHRAVQLQGKTKNSPDILGFGHAAWRGRKPCPCRPDPSCTGRSLTALPAPRPAAGAGGVLSPGSSVSAGEERARQPRREVHRGDLLSPTTATPELLNCPRNAFWMPRGCCVAASSGMLAPVTSKGKSPGPPLPGLIRIFTCRERKAHSRAFDFCCPMPKPATACGHGAAGTPALPGSQPSDDSSAEALGLDSATLSIPQQSGISPSSWIQQLREQTGPTPKPRALQEPRQVTRCAPKSDPSAAGQKELFT